MTARYPPFRTYVYFESVLDRKVDRNADTLQRTITDVCEYDPALQATGRTATNNHEQPMPYPPFGMPKISFESHHTSSEATSGLRLFCLWGNTSLTGKVTGTRSFTFGHLSLYLQRVNAMSLSRASLPLTWHLLYYKGTHVRRQTHRMKTRFSAT